MQKTSKVIFAFICVLFAFIRMGGPAYAGNSGIFTLSAWVKPETSVASKALVGKAEELRVFTDASGYVGCQIKSTTWQTAAQATTNALTLNTWSHIACTYDKTNIKIYVNGVGVGSSALTATLDDTTNALKYGIDDSASTPYSAFKGSIDELKFYNYARTQKQIVEDMNAGHPAVGSPVGTAVGYWKMDEGYGTAANNSGSGGNSLNGTFGASTAAPTWNNNGKYGKALSFDGSNDYVGTTDVGDNTTNLTISLWAKPTTVHNGYFIGKDDVGSNRSFVFGVTNTNDVEIYFQTAAGYDYSVSGSLKYTAGQWTHFTTTYSNGVTRVYVNGIESTITFVTNAASGVINNNSLATDIGRRNYGATPHYFNGLIDEVKIYNYALTEDEVKLEYNRGSAMVLGSLSDTSGLTGGQIASQSASAEYCIPGDTVSCNAPVGRWDFEEGTGGTVNDKSGNGNTGTWAGTGTRWTTGKIGKAGKFNGSDDYVIGTTAISPGTGSFTSEAWFKTQTTVFSQFVSLSQYASDALHKFFNLYIVSSTAKLGIRAYSEAQSVIVYDVQSSSAVNDNVWHHAAAVRNTSDNTLKLYLDGKLQGSLAIPANIDIAITSLPTIGAARDIYPSIIGNFLNGQVDDIRIYNYARTPAQIAWDYNRGKPVAQYKFDECQGVVAHDSAATLSVAGNNGSINIGTSAPQTSAGTCTDGLSTSAWYNGRNGKYNSSLNFDGTDDYVDATNNSIYNFTTAFTLSAWIKTTSNNVSPVLFKGDTDINAPNYGNLYRLFVSSGKINIIAIRSDRTVQSLNGNTTVNDGVYHQLVAVFDSSANKLYAYVDGKSDATPLTTSGTLRTSTSKLYIGADIADGTGSYSDKFAGQIDDVSVFNYALTAQQVKLLYNAGAAVQFAPITGSP